MSSIRLCEASVCPRLSAGVKACRGQTHRALSGCPGGTEYDIRVKNVLEGAALVSRCRLGKDVRNGGLTGLVQTLQSHFKRWVLHGGFLEEEYFTDSLHCASKGIIKETQSVTMAAHGETALQICCGSCKNVINGRFFIACHDSRSLLGISGCKGDYFLLTFFLCNVASNCFLGIYHFFAWFLPVHHLLELS